MTFIGFANSVALWGLLTLPVVLALHLLRQRSRRYVVSDLNLWSFLEHEVRGSRLRRIPLSLLLFVDLLIAALLTLAWAQPQVQVALPPTEGRQVILLLDSSASMRARDSLPSRYERAKAAALGLLTELGPRDSVTVISFGARPTLLGDTRTMSLPELIAAVSASQAGETASTALPAALAMAQNVPAPAETDAPPEVHIFTDAAFPELPGEPAVGPLVWHLYGSAGDNQAVFDVEAQPVGDGWQVFARLANFDSTQARRIVALLAEDRVVENQPVEIPPGSTVAQLWSLDGRPASVTVQLAGGDALPEDDSASMGLHQVDETRVGVVAGEPEHMRRALELVPGVDLRVLAPGEYVPGMDFDLTIFRDTLPEEWPAGVAVVVDPPASSETFSLGPAVQLNTVAVPAADPVLEGIDFSGVRWGPVRELTSRPPGYIPLLQAGETPLLLRGESERGAVYLFLPELEGGNLLRHPAFPLLLVNLVEAAAASPLPLQIGAGERLPLPSPARFPQLRLNAPGGSVVDLSSQRPAAWTDTLEPGRYRLEMTAAGGEEHAIVVGVNAGSLDESDIEPGNWPLTSAFTADSPPPTAATDSERTVNLMPWLLAAAAILLLLEAWLAWR